MVASRSNRRDTREETNITRTMDLDRGLSICCGIVSKLTVDVISPPPNRSITLEGETMAGPRSNRRNAREETDITWTMDLDRSISLCCGIIPNFAIGIPTPSPERAIAFEGKSLVVPYGNSRNICEKTDIARTINLDRTISLCG